MTRIDKEITINAPLEKVYNFVIKPSNLPQIWPSLMLIKNEQLLPIGGYSAQWVYKMGGKLLEGTGEYTDIIPNQWFTIKTTGEVESAITCTFRSKDEGQTRVTFTVDYHIPPVLLAWLAGKIIIKINEREAELLLTNLKAILEEG